MVKRGRVTKLVLSGLYILGKPVLLRDFTKKFSVNTPHWIYEVVKDLEEKELLIKEKYRKNRRIKTITLTEKGKDFVENIWKVERGKRK